MRHNNINGGREPLIEIVISLLSCKSYIFYKIIEPGDQGADDRGIDFRHIVNQELDHFPEFEQAKNKEIVIYFNVQFAF